MLIHLNGKLVPKEEAKVSVFDHGYLYGDGIFEGIRVYSGNIFRLEEHIDRLLDSARAISLRLPLDRAGLIQATAETVAANEKRDAYIRLVVSRGVGDLGIDPSKCPEPTLVIIVDSIALYPQEIYDNGISLMTASTRRIPMDCLDPRIKSLNYLNNILAKLEAANAGCMEAVMLNQQGFIAECTAENLFLIKKGVVKTPELLQGALGGITRGAVLELAREAGHPTEETRLALHDLYTADECFLTGTGAEVVGVIGVDGREIGDGKPGLMTQRLLAAFQELRVREGTRVDYTTSAATS